MESRLKNQNMLEKTCSICGRSKPLGEFHKCKAKKDGLQVYCKSCKREKDKKRLENDYDRKLEKNREWKRNNKDKVKEYQSEYQRNNRDRINENRRKNKRACKFYCVTGFFTHQKTALHTQVKNGSLPVSMPAAA